MVTRTTPCLANGPPAAPCKAPEPPTNPPPWIQTITGSLRAFAIGRAPDVQEQAILRRNSGALAHLRAGAVRIGPACSPLRIPRPGARPSTAPPAAEAATAGRPLEAPRKGCP